LLRKLDINGYLVRLIVEGVRVFCPRTNCF